MHIASKYGCLFEPKGELAQEYLRISYVQQTEIVTSYIMGIDTRQKDVLFVLKTYICVQQDTNRI